MHLIVWYKSKNPINTVTLTPPGCVRCDAMKALKNEAIVATVKLGFVLDRNIVVNVWNLETWFIVHWAYATTHIHIGVNKSKYLKQKREMKWSKKYFVSKTSGNIYIYLSLFLSPKSAGRWGTCWSVNITLGLYHNWHLYWRKNGRISPTKTEEKTSN